MSGNEPHGRHLAPTSSSDDQLCCASLLATRLAEPEATELAAILKALSDPVRLMAVSAIAASPDREICACDFPELLGRSQPTTSHHLAKLVEAGIVTREQRGRWAWFRLKPERLAALSALLAPG